MQFGLSSALNSHYFREEEENRSQLIMNVVIGDIILAFVCCLIASYLGALYSHLLLPNLPLNDENRYALWHIIIWTSFLTILVFLGRNVLTLREEAVKSVSLNMARYFLQIGLGLFVVVVIGWKGFGRQAMGLVGAAVTAIVSIRILARRSEGLFRWQQFCIVARTALTFYPSALINAFAITVNVWLLAHLTSAVEIGIYGVALMFGQFLGWPVTALHSGSFPTAAKMMRQGNAESRSRQSRIYSLMIVMTTLSALILATISPLAIELLTTSAYHEAKHYTSPIVLAFLFRGISRFAGQTLLFHGRGFWLSSANSIGIIAGVLLCWFLVPEYGSMGAALALAGEFLLALIVVMILGQWIYPLPWEIVRLLTSVVLALILGTIDFYTFNELPLLSAILYKLILLSFYVLVLVLMGVIPSQLLLRYLTSRPTAGS